MLLVIVVADRAGLLCCCCVLQPFAKLPVPSWQLGQSVALDEFKRVTDTYYKALEPARKLKTQQLPAQVSNPQRSKLGPDRARQWAAKGDTAVWCQQGCLDL
jgi:hypothetical protein